MKQSVNTLKHGDPKSAARILVDADQGRSGAFEQFSEGFRNMALENATSIYTFETNWYVLKKAEIAQIKVPTLIIRGQNTIKSSRYISDSLRKLLSDSTETVITRSGHFPQTENPEEFNSKLLIAHADCQPSSVGLFPLSHDIVCQSLHEPAIDACIFHEATCLMAGSPS